MLDKQREDQDLDRSRLFINKIKDHMHDKIKTKHIEKFEKLYFKCHGCHYNLSRHTNNSGNIESIPNTLSRQPNVPSSISSTSTTTSTSTSVPATPMAPHLPSAQQIPTHHSGCHPPAPTIQVQTTPKSGL